MPKQYYLDTEFNEHGGELISIALVDTEQRFFYAETPLKEKWKPWVLKHVKPLLTGPELEYTELRRQVAAFLGTVDCEIICDWPADIALLCELLDAGGGNRVGPRNIIFKLLGGIDCKPITPHHALSDAYALRHALLGY